MPTSTGSRRQAQSRPKSAESESLIAYSPSGEQTYRFCQKKYYFTWLTRHKQGWRKPAEHPWRQVHELKQLKTPSMWAGDLYHQIVARALKDVQSGRVLDPAYYLSLAHSVAAAQFAFSEAHRFRGATKSRVEEMQGIPIFLALSEHAYALPDDGILQETHDKIDSWIARTFAWGGWESLVTQTRRNRAVHIEPQNLYFPLAGARVSARMDIGVESSREEFTVYDWKCYGNPERSAASGRKVQQQLLAYMLWPVLRSTSPIPIAHVKGIVFNPATGVEETIRYTAEDQADFELVVGQWVRLQAQVFTSVGDVDFGDLDGPYDPSSACPYCPFRRICGEEISWSDLM